MLPLVVAGEAGHPLVKKQLADINRGLLSPAERCAMVDNSVRSDGDASTMVLSTLATDRCRRVREHTIDMIHASRPGVLDAMAAALAAKPAPAARAGAAYAAVKARGWAALDLLGSLAEDRKPGAIPVRLAVAAALATLDQEPSPKAAVRAANLAIALAGDKDLRVRLAAIAALAKRGACAEAQRALEILVLDPVEEVAREALEALLAAGADPARLTSACIKRLRTGTEVQERIALINALGRLGGTDATAMLVDMLLALQNQPRLSELRSAVCDALGQIASEDPAIITRCETVLRALAVGDRWAGCRMAALWALARMGSPLAIQAAIEALPRKGDEDLLWFLQQQTGQTFIAREAWQAWWKSSSAMWQTRRPGIQAMSSVEFYSLQDTTSDVAFVIDVSGSMADPMALSDSYSKAPGVGTKLEAAKRELWRCLRDLEPDTRVSLTWFSTSATTWGDGPVRATWRNKIRLREAFADIPPDGGTNSWAGLAAALDVAGLPAIFFLTDGQPTVGESTDPVAIAAGMAERNADRPQTARIHTLAFQLQPDADGRERPKQGDPKRNDEQARRAKAAGKPAVDEHDEIKVAENFLRRLSADSGGVFRQVN
jgi:HEAT repeat protein